MTTLAIVSCAGLVVATVWLARLTLPSSQAVRVRNAFLLRRGRAEDFPWTPSTLPPDFRVERSRAPAVIERAVWKAGLGDARDDWSRALALVSMLVRHSTREGAIQADLSTTYAGIVSGSGYCSDYVRVYIAAASSAGLFCRQWAFSFDGFGGHGHTFVEVYDRQRTRWLFVDVHNNVYAVLAGTEEPLAALALRDALLGSPGSIEFRRAGPGRLGFEHFDKLLDYYLRGVSQWYLWWGNDVITRDTGVRARWLQKVSGRLAHALGSMVDLPPLVALVTADNERAIARMEQLRRQVMGVLLLVAGLAVLVCVQVGWAMFGRAGIGRAWVNPSSAGHV